VLCTSVSNAKRKHVFAPKRSKSWILNSQIFGKEESDV